MSARVMAARAMLSSGEVPGSFKIVDSWRATGESQFELQSVIFRTPTPSG
jgi:hypothetical protein